LREHQSRSPLESAARSRPRFAAGDVRKSVLRKQATTTLASKLATPYLHVDASSPRASINRSAKIMTVPTEHDALDIVSTETWNAS
jgi:hypothetical protein